MDEFRAGVAKAVTYGHALGVPQLNCLAGKAPAGADAALLPFVGDDDRKFCAFSIRVGIEAGHPDLGRAAVDGHRRNQGQFPMVIKLREANQ